MKEKIKLVLKICLIVLLVILNVLLLLVCLPVKEAKAYTIPNQVVEKNLTIENFDYHSGQESSSLYVEYFDLLSNSYTYNSTNDLMSIYDYNFNFEDSLRLYKYDNTFYVITSSLIGNRNLSIVSNHYYYIVSTLYRYQSSLYIRYDLLDYDITNDYFTTYNIGQGGLNSTSLRLQIHTELWTKSAYTSDNSITLIPQYIQLAITTNINFQTEEYKEQHLFTSVVGSFLNIQFGQFTIGSTTYNLTLGTLLMFIFGLGALFIVIKVFLGG